VRSRIKRVGDAADVSVDKRQYARASGQAHVPARAETCRDKKGDFSVDANLTPYQPSLLAPNARHLRIVVVSEVRFLRESVAEILARDPSMSVVGLFADLSEAVALTPAFPDVVLLDAAFPAGAAAVIRTRHIAPELRVIAFAVRETEEDIISWAQAGVIGYVPSTAALSDLVRLVMEIHDGEQLCSGRVAAGLLRRIAVTASLGDRRDPTSPLTARERQIAEVIATGLSDKEIARRLNISLATTKSHVHNLLGKLNAQRRGEVVARLREYENPPG
jgi:two-component system nitrate/nitrite response regulator NarL